MSVVNIYICSTTQVDTTSLNRPGLVTWDTQYEAHKSFHSTVYMGIPQPDPHVYNEDGIWLMASC